MTRALATRRTAGILAATLALGISAPAAGAKPIDLGPADLGPAASSPISSGALPTPLPAIHLTTGHPAGGVSDWGYVAIGSGLASIALISAGGTHVTRRRRRHHAGTRPRVTG